MTNLVDLRVRTANIYAEFAYAALAQPHSSSNNPNSDTAPNIDPEIASVIASTSHLFHDSVTSDVSLFDVANVALFITEIIHPTVTDTRPFTHYSSTAAIASLRYLLRKERELLNHE